MTYIHKKLEEMVHIYHGETEIPLICTLWDSLEKKKGTEYVALVEQFFVKFGGSIA